jgi:D-lactate dehydrogenase
MKLFIYSCREFDEKPIFDRLCKQYGIAYDYTTEYPSNENIQLAAGYDAISVTPIPIEASFIKKVKMLGVKAILNRSIGYDHVDLETASNIGIKVSHVAYPPDSVADYAIMLMLMSLRKINFITEAAKLQDFSLKGKIGKNIGQAKVGIIGTGQIGKTVMQHLTGFGCDILAYDPYPNNNLRTLCQYVSLEQLLEQSDIITLHSPATKDNYHLINKEALAKMKSNAIVINTARGALVDVDALILALENKQIAGAAIDVLENESELIYFDRKGEVLKNHQVALLHSLPNVIYTPHTAFYTAEVVERMAQITVECLVDLMSGKKNKFFIV